MRSAVGSRSARIGEREAIGRGDEVEVEAVEVEAVEEVVEVAVEGVMEAVE